jgi:hypothetical protein
LKEDPRLAWRVERDQVDASRYHTDREVIGVEQLECLYDLAGR